MSKPALPKVTVIAAMLEGTRGIGNKGLLPWDENRFPEDKRFFSNVTTSVPPEVLVSNPETRNAVVMGNKTFQSLGSMVFLSGRANIVVSTHGKKILPILTKIPPKTTLDAYMTLEDALIEAAGDPTINKIFVIGGQQIFERAFNLGCVEEVYLTRVHHNMDADTFMPSFEEDYTPVTNSKTLGSGIAFQRYLRKENKEEKQYLNLVKDIIDNGEIQSNRTGIDCYVVWGRQMRFDLSTQFPLLTTKKIAFRSVVEELLWFVRGDTDTGKLSAKGVKIWEGNTTREFLDARALYWERNGRKALADHFRSRKPGDAGPIYGFNWRYFGAKYVDCETDYSGQGFDQLTEIVRRLKEEPSARDIMLTSYDPVNVRYCVLPPCHVLCHFMVTNKGQLNCHMFQRSCDIGLGVPFNIASYALLTCMLAKVCDLKPGELVHTLSNTHAYSNHLEALNKQLEREPKAFPRLEIEGSPPTSIDGWRYEDFRLVGYESHNAVSMRMAV